LAVIAAIGNHGAKLLNIAGISNGTCNMHFAFLQGQFTANAPCKGAVFLDIGVL